MSEEQIKLSIIETADSFGEIRFLSTPPKHAMQLVREGRLVRISYLVFSLPEGG